MAESDGNIQIPGWAGKAVLGLFQGIMATAIIATATWAWNTEGRVASLEYELAQANATIASQEAKLSTVDSHDTEIEVLKTELKFIREDLAEIKSLIASR